MSGVASRDQFLMELTEVMRQKDDQQFAQLLMRVRTANCSHDDINVLKSRVISKSDALYPGEALHVFKTNQEVDEHNADHLKKLPSQVFEITPLIRRKMSKQVSSML